MSLLDGKGLTVLLALWGLAGSAHTPHFLPESFSSPAGSRSSA